MIERWVCDECGVPVQLDGEKVSERDYYDTAVVLPRGWERSGAGEICPVCVVRNKQRMMAVK